MMRRTLLFTAIEDLSDVRVFLNIPFLVHVGSIGKPSLEIAAFDVVLGGRLNKAFVNRGFDIGIHFEVPLFVEGNAGNELLDEFAEIFIREADAEFVFENCYFR